MAFRGGQLETLALLIEYGADINARAFHRWDQSPLNIAIEYHGTGHPVSILPINIGAVDLEPGY